VWQEGEGRGQDVAAEEEPVVGVLAFVQGRRARGEERCCESKA